MDHNERYSYIRFSANQVDFPFDLIGFHAIIIPSMCRICTSVSFAHWCRHPSRINNDEPLTHVLYRIGTCIVIIMSQHDIYYFC